MKINSTRLSLARSRIVRQARRSGRTKILNGNLETKLTGILLELIGITF